MREHFAAEGRSVAASLGRRAWPHREGEGVTAITGRVQRTGGQGIEVGAYFFAVPSFTGWMVGTEAEGLTGWGMWTDWILGAARSA